MASEGLNGATVLVTRPAGQSAGLGRLVESAGGEAVVQPLLEIEAAQPGDAGLSSTPGLFDMWVFVSRNAVVHGLAWIRRSGIAVTESTMVVAVGPGTAAALESEGVLRVVSPAGRSNSEELLALPAMQEVSGKRVLIFRGQDGRELLAEELAGRGAEVTYVSVYRRRPVGGAALSTILKWLGSARPVLVLTSVAALDALLAVVPPGSRSGLLDVPVAAIGERVAAACRDAGWKAPIGIADETGDAGLVGAAASVYQQSYRAS